MPPSRELLEVMSLSRREELAAENAAHRPARHLSLLSAWARSWLAPPRPVEPGHLSEVRRGELAVTFGGHATLLVRTSGLSVLCDPMLGMRLRMARRAVEPGLGADALARIDLVLITHAHPGHLHLPTLERLSRDATVIVPTRTAARISRLGFARVIELALGRTHREGALEVTATPVRHESSVPACAYLLRGDGPSLYVCGDSGYFSGFAEVGRLHAPDIAALPIAGYLPRSFRERHLSPPDALAAFEDLGARMLIPTHFGAFLQSYEKLGDPRCWLEALVRERSLEGYVTILDDGASAKFASRRG